MTTDTPILRADILNMTLSDYDTWLVGVRERQMANRRKYEEVERAKSLAHVDKLTPRLDKMITTLHNKSVKIENDIEKISELIVKCQIIRQEILDELAYAKLDHPELKLSASDGNDQGADGESDGKGDPIETDDNGGSGTREADID